MYSVLEPYFERLQRQKDSTLLDLAGWKKDDLLFRPAPTAWCALEVLDHLVRVEREFIAGCLGYIEKGPPIRLRDRLGALIVTQVMRMPVKVKAPRGAKVMPEGSGALEETVIRWNGTRQELRQLVNTMSVSNLSRGVFRHPVSGWMSMPQALVFLSAHLEHHRYQFGRLKAALMLRGSV